MKLGNAHRILRYCLYKNNKKDLECISYLNCDAVKLAL
jgi:hypothetical protein